MTQTLQEGVITLAALAGLCLTLINADAGTPLPPRVIEVRGANDLVVAHTVAVSTADFRDVELTLAPEPLPCR